MAIVCIAVITVGCIDEFKTEETPTPTIVPTLIPVETIIPGTIIIDKEKFIEKYTEAKEIFKYDSYEPELKGNESENLGNSYYEKGQFNKAKNKYHEAIQFYLVAKEQNLEAKALFEEAYEIAPTEYYKELCVLYISATQSNINTMNYMSSILKHMEKVCDYYEKEDYKAGDKELEKSNEELIRYNIEIDILYDKIEEIDKNKGW